MTTREYWEQVALLREQYAQEQADQIILQINRLYDQVQQDILAEMEKVFSSFSELTGLSDDEAREYISKAQQDAGVSELRQLLAQTDDPMQRVDLTNRINAQAYGARLTRLEAVQENAYRAIKKVAIEEQERLGNMLEDVYADGYYQSIHDIGKGTNVGIDFAVVSDRQIKQAIERPWQGATFSERVWRNTDALAAKAGQVILRGVATGADVYTMAKQLQLLAKSGKYAAVRLVRTETNHIYNQAQLDAYDSAGIEQYQFLATLDYRTCEICQPLDGKVFNRSEAMGGINYPTMHPNCRCTTTVPMAYASRWANDGAHKYKTDGNVTYARWAEQMSPEQKAAFDRHVKQWRNKASDMAQYERYKERLGAENMPKTFDLWQELKYTEIKEYEDFKGWYRYRGDNPKASRNDYHCAAELHSLFSQGSFHIPAKEIDTATLGFDDIHINKERKHKVSEAAAKEYIQNAKASRTVWQGQFERYYSLEGAAYINTIKREIRTAYSSREFDDDMRQIMEVLKKYGI